MQIRISDPRGSGTPRLGTASLGFYLTDIHRALAPTPAICCFFYIKGKPKSASLEPFVGFLAFVV